MGYSFDEDLTINCSDTAADAFFDLASDIIAKLKEIEKGKSNKFNTPAILNVAMIISEAFNTDPFIYDEDFMKYVKSIIKKLEKFIEKSKKLSDKQWGDAENKERHIFAYYGVLRALDRMVAP